MRLDAMSVLRDEIWLKVLEAVPLRQHELIPTPVDMLCLTCNMWFYGFEDQEMQMSEM